MSADTEDSNDDIDHIKILELAVSIANASGLEAHKRKMDGHELTIAMTQALALIIDVTAKTGYKKSVASDMSAIIFAYPPIESDEISEAIH